MSLKQKLHFILKLKEINIKKGGFHLEEACLEAIATDIGLSLRSSEAATSDMHDTENSDS